MNERPNNSDQESWLAERPPGSSGSHILYMKERSAFPTRIRKGLRMADRNGPGCRKGEQGRESPLASSIMLEMKYDELMS